VEGWGFNPAKTIAARSAFQCAAYIAASLPLRSNRLSRRGPARGEADGQACTSGGRGFSDINHDGAQRLPTRCLSRSKFSHPARRHTDRRDETLSTRSVGKARNAGARLQPCGNQTARSAFQCAASIAASLRPRSGRAFASGYRQWRSRWAGTLEGRSL